MSIKSICPDCKRVEKHSASDHVTHLLTVFLMLAGVIFIFSLVVIGPINYLNSFTGSILTNNAMSNSEELRHLALNYTTYEGYNSFEFADDLMLNMPSMRYVLQTKGILLHDIEETMDYGGDCKEQSIVVSSLLMSVGYDAFVDCNIEYNHCVVNVPYQAGSNDKQELYMIIDPTGETARIYDNKVNHWETPDDSLRVRMYGKNPKIDQE